MKRAWMGVFGLCLVGCEQPLVINSQREPILGGDPAVAGQFSSVVAIAVSQGQRGLCTGTLIKPDTVLTAAHCIDAALTGLQTPEAVAQQTIVVLGATDLNNPQGAQIKNVRQVIQHPDHPNFTSGTGLGQHDIGIILLDSPVQGFTPSAVELDPNRDLSGLTVTNVGFGLTDPGNQASAGKLFFVENTIDACAAFNFNDDTLICFDQSDGIGSCSGDSGGPVFEGAPNTPGAKVLGVTSFGDQNCAQFGAYTRASFEADFVQPFIDGTAPDCSTDGQCNAACGQGFNPEDLDCDVTPPVCNNNGAFDDCEDGLFDGGGCSIHQGSTQSSVAFLFAFFGIGLFLSRKRFAR